MFELIAKLLVPLLILIQSEPLYPNEYYTLTPTKIPSSTPTARLIPKPTVRVSTPSANPTTTLVVPNDDTKLERIKNCESGGNYSINSGNGYYGAYQFDLPTWQSVGGTGLPSDASPEEQDMRAQMLVEKNGGYGAWHVCSQR